MKAHEGFGPNLENWAILGPWMIILVFGLFGHLDWAVASGQFRERVKSSYTLDWTPCVSRDPIINWMLFVIITLGF